MNGILLPFNWRSGICSNWGWVEMGYEGKILISCLSFSNLHKTDRIKKKKAETTVNLPKLDLLVWLQAICTEWDMTFHTADQRFLKLLLLFWPQILDLPPSVPHADMRGSRLLQSSSNRTEPLHRVSTQPELNQPHFQNLSVRTYGRVSQGAPSSSQFRSPALSF